MNTNHGFAIQSRAGLYLQAGGAIEQGRWSPTWGPLISAWIHLNEKSAKVWAACDDTIFPVRFWIQPDLQAQPRSTGFTIQAGNRCFLEGVSPAGISIWGPKAQVFTSRNDAETVLRCMDTSMFRNTPTVVPE